MKDAYDLYHETYKGKTVKCTIGSISFYGKVAEHVGSNTSADQCQRRWYRLKPKSNTNDAKECKTTADEKIHKKGLKQLEKVVTKNQT